MKRNQTNQADDLQFGHRIYYFVNPDDPDAVISTEAYLRLA